MFRRSPELFATHDERSALWLVQRYLADAGFETVSTFSGTEAANLLRDVRTRFDLVLTDVFMPEVSGYHLARVALERDPELPVLFISGFTFDVLTPARINYGFLAKPFTRPTLIRAVSVLLEQRRTAPAA